MKKKQYILELKTNQQFVKKGDLHSADVKKVQEWINLWKYSDKNWNISISIDGDFGNETHNAVIEFQGLHNLKPDGIIGNLTWRQLTEPMRKAFTRIDVVSDLRSLVVLYAEQHLKASARELNQNEGTWVRAYMDGNEGSQWPWCVGFVQTIIDQASYTQNNKDLTEYLPLTYNCDDLGNYAKKKNRFISNKDLIQKIDDEPDTIEKGDIFLVCNERNEWSHTGLIIDRDNDWITTIEGNSNDEGSREGYEVCQRKRNFHINKIDIIKIK